MRTYTRDYLKEKGFIWLTGEACRLGKRVLVDLTLEAKAIFERFMGGTLEVEEGSNWNYSKDQVASVMIPHSMFIELLIFTVYLEEDHDWIAYTDDGWTEVTGMSDTERGRLYDENDIYDTEDFGNYRWVRGQSNARTPGVADRNIHQMSGRTV